MRCATADVALFSATEVTEVDLAGRLSAAPGTILQAEQVIALPRLRGAVHRRAPARR